MLSWASPDIYITRNMPSSLRLLWRRATFHHTRGYTRHTQITCSIYSQCVTHKAAALKGEGSAGYVSWFWYRGISVLNDVSPQHVFFYFSNTNLAVITPVWQRDRVKKQIWNWLMINRQRLHHLLLNYHTMNVTENNFKKYSKAYSVWMNWIWKCQAA